MQKKRFSGINDYLALLVRRKWYSIIAFIVLAALTILLSTIMPKIYVSQSMLMVQTSKMPEDFVKDLISGSTTQRLVSIELKILSRTNLLKILSQFERDLTGYRGLNEDQERFSG